MTLIISFILLTRFSHVISGVGEVMIGTVRYMLLSKARSPRSIPYQPLVRRLTHHAEEDLKSGNNSRAIRHCNDGKC